MNLLDHPALCRSLRKAYSAEIAAAFAYIGHAGSLPVTEGNAKAQIRQIELDEWGHRRNVCEYFVMMQYFHFLGITEYDEVLYEVGASSNYCRGYKAAET